MSNILKSYQFNYALKGTYYLEYLIKHRNIDINIMRLYEECAKHFNTTATQVERACRYAIAEAFSNNEELFRSLYPRKLTKEPKLGDFIYNYDA